MTASPRHHLDPHGMTARVFLAFLATAGIFYVNIMPALVDGLIKGLGFTAQQAGAVGSANLYGAAAGALLVVFIVGRLPWRATALGLLVTLIVIDALCMLLTTPTAMIALRFVNGFIGGALVGLAFSIIARTRGPDRTFGVLLVVQFGLGGLGVQYLPRLVPVYGTDILFWSLIAFSAVTLAMLAFIPEYPPREASPEDPAVGPRRSPTPLVLALLATFAFQAANMGLYAFIIGLGEHYGLSVDFITGVLGPAAWIGILGSLLVVWLSDRAGYVKPLSAGIGLTALGFVALYHADIRWLFLVSNLMMGVTWAFVIPYLLGLNARFDTTGRMAALGGFASKMGLASGPVIAAWALGDDNYSRVIAISLAVLIAGGIVAMVPAALLDRRKRQAHSQ